MEDVPLREHIEGWQREHLALHNRELRVSDDKVNVLENRLAGMNEFRAALNDAQRTFATRDMLDQRDGAADARIKLLENKWANLDGKMALFALIPTVISAASFIYAVTK